LNKIPVFFNAITRLMDGSLFFRGLTALLNAIKNICAGGFIARAFVADEKKLEDSINRSFFAAIADEILNGLPKPIKSPTHLGAALSRIFSGSWIINSICEGVNAPIPPADNTIGFGLKQFFQWVMFILPALGILTVLFAVPFLPTMWLAAVLVPIILFTFLSRKFTIDGTAVFLLIFILISIIVSYMSFAPRASIQIALLTAIFIISALVVVAIATTKKSVDFFILAFVGSAGITGIVGIYQVLAGYRSDLWLDQELFADIGNRVVSTFGNPNVYATYLLLAIPITAACIIFLKHPFLKLCAFGATGLLLVNLLLTYSRGAYVALALAIGVFVLIIEKRLVVLFIPAVLALPLVLPQNILNRLLSIINFSDTSTIFRMAIWQGSLRMVQDFWLSGVGQGLEAFYTVYPYYALAAAGALHAHNMFLQILVEVGIGGFLIFICILACFFRVQANFMRQIKDFRLKVMSAAFVSAMIAFLAISIFDHSFFNFRVMLIFYLFIGLSVAFARSYNAE